MPLWVVVIPKSSPVDLFFNAPSSFSRWHQDEDIARKEAERLCRKEGKRACLLKLEAVVEVDEAPVRWEIVQ